MKSRLRIGISIFFVGLLLATVALVVHKNDPDLSRDEAPFNSIVLPPRSVTGTIYMDGGSVWVTVVDGEGEKFDFAFPYDYHLQAGTHYPAAFHGASLSSAPDAKAFHNSERAKGLVLNLLERYSKPEDRHTMIVYDYLAEKMIPLKSVIASGRELLK